MVGFKARSAGLKQERNRALSRVPYHQCTELVGGDAPDRMHPPSPGFMSHRVWQVETATWNSEHAQIQTQFLPPSKWPILSSLPALKRNCIKALYRKRSSEKSRQERTSQCSAQGSNNAGVANLSKRASKGTVRLGLVQNASRSRKK